MAKLIKSNLPLILVLLLSLSITWPVFKSGYFTHHDDLQVMRVFEMRKCFTDFQIPCRWVPDMGFGNGFPLFNYYGVLPYYTGALVSFILGFVGAAKALFFIPLVLGGISMFFLGKELGGKWVGITTSVLYIFAPYRSLDTYVRGAISESFALAIIPLVFLFLLKLSKQNSKKNFILLSLSLAAFLTTHNIMIMLFSPLIFLTVLFILFKKKNYKNILLSLILGVGLSAFFLFPAFLEKGLVQTDTLTRFDLDFRVHFVTIKQLFLNRSWGYGASVLGPNDTISFQIGWPHWWLVLVSLFFILKRKNLLLISLLGVFLLSAFMTHNKSAFVWEKIGILRYTQFPWRFLSVVIFSASLIGGLVVGNLKQSLQKYLAVLIIILSFSLNFSYFKPDKFYPLTDNQKLSGKLWDEQRKAAVEDYLPIGAYPPKEPAPYLPLILKGKAVAQDYKVYSNSFRFNADVENSAQIQVPIFDFPNWQIFVNGKLTSHDKNNLLRRIQVNLTPGKYIVEGKFGNTKIRTISNLISLVSFLILIFLSFKKLNYAKN